MFDTARTSFRRAGLIFAAAAVLTAGVQVASVWAKKEDAAPPLFRYAPGDGWQVEDTLLVNIGASETPSTRGSFQYKVDRVLADGTAVVSSRIVRLQSGPSLKALRLVPLGPPEKPAQTLLMTAKGSVYGPYVKPSDVDAARKTASLQDWRKRDPKPWIWYKIPLKELGVGASGVRALGPERWRITRLADGTAGGVACAVYEATLKSADVEIKERTWFSAKRGAVLKREVTELRARDKMSVAVTQVRRS